LIRLFRRHRTTCKQISETYRRCACPIYAEGKVGQERLDKTALNLTSWEAAQKWVRERETAGTLNLKHEITLEDALKKFIEDCEARNLNSSTLRKYRLLESAIKSFGGNRGLLLLSGFDASLVREFRSDWKYAPRTASKQLERLRSFFRFCQENDWITKNPASHLKPPIVRNVPREPFSDGEQAKILAWANNPTKINFKLEGTFQPHEKTGTFLKLLLYTGLRITDAATLQKERLDNGRILLYTQKTGRPVWLPIPKDLIAELEPIPGPDFFASPGGSSRGETVSDYWRDQIHKVLTHVGITGTPHRFRHTLAVNMLNHGSSIEDVALVLGNSPQIVALHYSTFVTSRQERIAKEIEKTWARPAKLVRVK
jgi:integrase/recombinase XerD